MTGKKKKKTPEKGPARHKTEHTQEPQRERKREKKKMQPKEGNTAILERPRRHRRQATTEKRKMQPLVDVIIDLHDEHGPDGGELAPTSTRRSQRQRPRPRSNAAERRHEHSHTSSESSESSESKASQPKRAKRNVRNGNSIVYRDPLEQATLIEGIPFFFDVNENVFCFDGATMYRAQVLARTVAVDEQGALVPSYYVHFHGWKKGSDSWVEQCRVLKQTPVVEAIESQGIRKELAMAAAKRKAIKAKKTAAKTGQTPRISASKAAEESFASIQKEFCGLAVNIAIPDGLKRKLVIDWENVTQKAKSVTLPSEPSITAIVAHYTKYVDKQGDIEGALAANVMEGVKTYFRQSLRPLLLYSAESEAEVDSAVAAYAHQQSQTQHEPPSSSSSSSSLSSSKTKAPGFATRTPEPKLQPCRTLRRKVAREDIPMAAVDVCDVFGGIHLLRLFTVLPGLLPRTDIDELGTRVTLTQLTGLLRHMQRHTHTLVPVTEGNYYSERPAATTTTAAAKASIH